MAQKQLNGVTYDMVMAIQCDSTGTPMAGSAVEGSAPILSVVGGDKVGNVRTATLNNGLGSLQWARVHPITAVVIDIAGATASSYTLAPADVGFIVRPYVVNYFPMGTSSAVVTA